jgi:tetratricopeptide (TPR) repeat protein
MRRLLLMLLLLVSIFAQGRVVMEQAIAAYPKAYPDQPLWQEAIRTGKKAVELAPNRPEPLRFLAEVYSRSNWYGPAYQTWEQLLALGEPLDADAIPLFRAVTFELAYGAYDSGNDAKALEYFQRIVEIVPYDKDAYVWAGRVLLETGRPEEASAYWKVAVERDPTDERSQFFLKLSQDQTQWGVDAANAFREGIALYEEGDLPRASERFNRAVGRNEMYSEAWAWLGRVAFERSDYVSAVTYYQEANRLEPQNETYSYFFEESQRRVGN